MDNSTNSATPFAQSQPVAGPSILWALIALALTAMSQQSCSSKGESGAPDEYFSPYRISPFTCLEDTIHETLHLLQLLRTWLECRILLLLASLEDWLLGPASFGTVLTSVAVQAQSSRQKVVFRLKVNGGGELPWSMLGTRLAREEQAEDQTVNSSKSEPHSTLQAVPSDEHSQERTAFDYDCEAQASSMADQPEQIEESIPKLVRSIWTLNVYVNRKHSFTAEPSILAMTVILFALGALPQAVKLFSYQGIPLTQTAAALYLAAIVVHSIHSLAAKQPLTIQRQSGDKCFSLQAARTVLMTVFYTVHGLVWFCTAVQLPIWGPSRSQVVTDTGTWKNIISPALGLVMPFFLFIMPFILHPGLTALWFWIIYWHICQLENLEKLAVDVVTKGKGNPASLFDKAHYWGFFASKDLLMASSITAAPAILTSLLIAASINRTIKYISRLARARHELAESTTQSVTQPLLQDTDQDVPANAVDDSEDSADASFNRKRSISDFLSKSVHTYFDRVKLHAVTPFLAMFPWMIFSAAIDRLDVQTQWMAFVVYHFLTAALYYGMVFDGSGTNNPGWTYILG